MANASGVDFLSSWATEGVDIAAGTYGGFTYSSVGRYLNLTNSEINNLHSHGLSIWFISENTSGTGPQGLQGHTPRDPGFFTYQQGQWDAVRADNGFTALSSSTYGAVPASCLIYFTVDFDASSTAINGILDYFRGVVATLGVGRVGAYGSGYVINNLGANGLIANGWQSESTGWRQNSTLGPYTGLWQKFLAGANVNGHAVDNNLMYVNDWGQWPSPSGSTTAGGGTNTAVVKGGTNNATQSVSSSFAQDSKHSLITPYESQDQVVYSSTTTTTLVAGTTSNFYSIATGVGQYAYPVGIFSTDGGSTWSDLGFADIAAATGSVSPSVQIVPKVDGSGTISFDGVNTTVGTANLTISIALLNAFGATTVPVKAHQTSQSKSYTNIYQTQNLFQPPYSTYRRIASDASVASNSTVAHGQTTVPYVSVWAFANNKVTIRPNAWATGGGGTLIGTLAARVDSSNVKINFAAPTTIAFYRVYKDNS